MSGVLPPGGGDVLRFVIDVAEMVPDGPFGDTEPLADLPVAQAAGGQAQHLDLTFGRAQTFSNGTPAARSVVSDSAASTSTTRIAPATTAA